MINPSPPAPTGYPSPSAHTKYSIGLKLGQNTLFLINSLTFFEMNRSLKKVKKSFNSTTVYKLKYGGKTDFGPRW